MKFSKEKIDEIKEKIRLEMVKNPHTSILEIQEKLCYNNSRKYDKNFIGRLKKKIHKERADQIKNDLIIELAQLEELTRVGRYQLISIAFNDGGKYKAKEIIRAYSTIILAENLLFEAKLNAGIFNIKGEKIKDKPLTPEQISLIDKAQSLLCVNKTSDKI